MARLACDTVASSELPCEKGHLIRLEKSQRNTPRMRDKQRSLGDKQNASAHECHAKEERSKHGKVARLEHVDSMMLPSLNGTTSKSYQQGILLAKEGARSPVRATPRRTVKQPPSYALMEHSLIREDDESQASDWSQIAESVDDESELDDLQPRQLWSSPSKKLFQGHMPIGVVDLTSPRKSSREETGNPAASLRRTRTKSSSDEDRDAILRL